MERYHQNSHISHYWHLPLALKNKYNDLVIADSLRMLALSMISLFIPIFLLEYGFSVLEVAMMELGLFMGCLLGHRLLLANISILGIKKIMIASYFFNILLYLSLFYIDRLVDNFGGVFFLFFIAVLDVFGMTLYWTSHHVYFLGVAETKNEGKRLGLLLAIPSLISMSGPFVGSLLISNYSFRGVFLISTILLITAAYVLFFTNDVSVKLKLKAKDFWDFHHLRKNLIFIIQGASYVATGFIWPLLLFFMSVKLVSMGIIYFISNILYASVSYFGGKISDTKNSKKISRISSVGHGLSLIFRSLSNTVIMMTAFQAMGGFFGGLLHVSLDTGFFKHSRRKMGSAIMNRELYMHFGRMMAVLIFLAALPAFGLVEALVFVMIICGAMVFCLNILIEKKNFLVD